MKTSATAGRKRSAARLAAVQALYQLGQIATDTPTDVIEQFTRHRFTTDGEEAPAVEPDGDFFTAIVSGASQRRGEIETLIGSALATGWTVERIERVSRAILIAGTFELMARDDVPAKVAINEYVEIAHAFYEDNEPGFVNSVLDRLAHRLRAAEFEPGAKAGA
jgi:N utilization substance protein B